MKAIEIALVTLPDEKANRFMAKKRATLAALIQQNYKRIWRKAVKAGQQSVYDAIAKKGLDPRSELIIHKPIFDE